MDRICQSGLTNTVFRLVHQLRNRCKMEMKVYIRRMIEENIRMFIVMDDEIEIKKLPLFLRDIKHLRREHRSVIEIAEEIAGIIKQM